MKILITGGLGLIGLELAKLLQTDHDIVVLDKKHSELDVQKFSFICKDLTEISLGDIDNDFDGIIHLAALSRVIHGEMYPLECWSSNVEGTNNIISILKKQNPHAWIIYGSSREIYGEPQNFPVSEAHPTSPNNRYGVSKFSAEQNIQNYCKNYHSPGIIFRFSNVYGSLNDHPDRVIPKFVNLALVNKALELHGSQNIFDFTFIDDTINGIISGIKLLQRMILAHETDIFTINLCSGIGTSLESLASKIITLTNSNSSYYETESRSYDVTRFIGDFSRAKQLLNYEPKFTLEKGLIEYITKIKNSFSTIIEESN